MAINWNQAEYVSPKLQITPEQLPLEAAMKVGDIQQDRYDKSYENLTKSQEAIRQMVNLAHDVDKEEANRIFSQYSDQIKGIDKEDLHNARWRTLKLATEAANNYSTIAQRNKQIQAQEEAISKDPRWALSRDKKLQDFRNKLKSIGYDNENKRFNNVNVESYSAPADVNIQEKSIKYGSLMRPENFGFQNGSMVYKKADGTETKNVFEASAIYHVVDGEKTQKLTPEQIQKAVTSVIMNDAEVKAMMNWDLGYEGIDPNNPEHNELYNNYINQTVTQPVLGASQLLQINDSFTNNDVTVGGGVNGNGTGDVNDNSFYEPTSINNPYAGKDKDNLSKTWKKALSGDTKSEFLIRNTIPVEIEKIRKTDPDKADKLNEEYQQTIFYKELADKYPVLKEALIESTGRLDPTGAATVTGLVNSGVVKVTEEEKKKINSSNVGVNSGGFWDSDLEDLYDAAESNSFRNISIQRPGLTNTKFRNNLSGLDLTIDAFNIDKDSWKGDSKKVKVVGWSTEPLGNGQGHVYELQDEKGETYYAEAKKTTGRALQFEIAQNAYSPMLSLENYKHVPIPDKPMLATDVLKAGKIPYLKDKKPNYAFEPNAQITPTEKGTFILTYGNDMEPQEYASIYQLLAENENKNFK